MKRKNIQSVILLGLILVVSACGKNQNEKTVNEEQKSEFSQIFVQSTDIGNPLIKGKLSFDEVTGTYSVSGGGENIWHQSDEFFFAYDEIEGDFALSTKLDFAPEVEGSNIHRKAGIMIRESLDADACYADIAIHYGDGLTSLQYRPIAGEKSDEVKIDILSADYLTLERKANKIIVKVNTGEFTDIVSGEIDINLPEKCYVGFFINSHNINLEETAYFSEVKLVK